MTEKSQDATTDTRTDSLTNLETLTDPARFRNHDGVRYEERTETHADADHYRAHSRGMAVVGVTAADSSVLVATHLEEPVALLPNARLEDGEGWLAAAERAVETLTDEPIDVGPPVLIRDLEHRLEGDDTAHTTSHTVIFEAAPEADGATAANLTARTTCNWDADWVHSFPDGCTATPERAAADIRLFLE
ncbi:hypothetical protein OB919_16460 [Halobacteria archaeon AArc-curdl1]|uniref:Uncharacterized protein n=1 Tax=Natronosalvus hydrolyticus TaxID=2979988 RepID=A0AAP2ZA81_9EURY|nr:hypothetical protein [Halobacteria archaeon AArc-curdl1]